MSILVRPTRHRAPPAKTIMTLDSEGAAPLITVSGEVDMSTAHLISELAEHVIARHPVRLILDLSQVTFFSAHDITALLQTQHAEVPMTLREAAPCVTYLLGATGTRMNLDVPATEPSGSSNPGLGSAERGDGAPHQVRRCGSHRSRGRGDRGRVQRGDPTALMRRLPSPVRMLAAAANGRAPACTLLAPDTAADPGKAEPATTPHSPLPDRRSAARRSAGG